MFTVTNKTDIINRKWKIKPEGSNKHLIENLIKFISKYSPVKRHKWGIMSSKISEEGLNQILTFLNLKIFISFKNQE